MITDKMRERMKKAAAVMHFHTLTADKVVDALAYTNMQKAASADKQLLEVAAFISDSKGTSDTLSVYEELGGTFNSKARR